MTKGHEFAFGYIQIFCYFFRNYEKINNNRPTTDTKNNFLNVSV